MGQLFHSRREGQQVKCSIRKVRGTEMLPFTPTLIRGPSICLCSGSPQKRWENPKKVDFEARPGKDLSHHYLLPAEAHQLGAPGITSAGQGGLRRQHGTGTHPQPRDALSALPQKPPGTEK